MKVYQLFAWYRNTQAFIQLAPNTKKSYEEAMNFSLESIGMHNARGIRPRQVDSWYKELCANGKQTKADHTIKILRVIWNVALRAEYVDMNPFMRMKMKAYTPRRVLWTSDQVDLFIEQAESMGHSNVGRLILFCYHLCQRPGDMIALTWANYDRDTGLLTFEQQKTKAIVSIPVTDRIKGWLDAFYGSHYPTDKILSGYTPIEFSHMYCVIRRAAGLPETLQMRDLRRTGITEMIEAGVSDRHIMTVSGHNSPLSIKPYHVNTVPMASDAMEKRFGRRKKDVD